jgi:FtsP/CotA-like multicopper oxidase with cupredoxin domain
VSASVLLALDLVAAIATTGAWIAAAVLCGGMRQRGPGTDAAPATAALTVLRRRTARLVLALFGAGVVGVLAQGVVIALLAAAGWWFVQEKVVLALPLVVTAAVAGLLLAAPDLLAVARGRRPAPGARGSAALVAAAAAGVAGIVVRLVIGYPLEPVPALVLLALVLLCTALAWAVLTGRPRRVVTGLAAFSVLLLVGSLGVAWLGAAALPGALAATHHGPDGPDAPPGAVSVTELRTPADQPGTVRSFDLTAQQQQVRLPSGTEVSAWTYGSLPGPELRVTQGDPVEVTLRNADIAAGATIHWHGYDVPAGEDGVAGVTQDAVRPGESFTYRFATPDAGTYWYHTHQVSAEGVRRGLFGTLVVLPPSGVPESVDLTVPLHTLGGAVLLGGSDVPATSTVAAGQSVRLRLVNTDQVPHRFRVDGAPVTVVAADGRDLPGGAPVTGKTLRVPAGGRLDVSLVMPETGVRLSSNASTTATLALAPVGVTPPAARTGAPDDLDLLGYGVPDRSALAAPASAGQASAGRTGAAQALPAGQGRVEATMVLDRLPRFLGGRPLYGYTVNGAVFPHIPSIEVTEGNRVRLTVVNRGADTHPMHVHGHHVLVVERDGIRSTGAPLWLDTFDVQPGEVWVVEFVADNPGVWMDHCHNLDHAAEGMMMALSYRGVTSPFEQGGPHANRSE